MLGVLPIIGVSFLGCFMAELGNVLFKKSPVYSDFPNFNSTRVLPFLPHSLFLSPCTISRAQQYQHMLNPKMHAIFLKIAIPASQPTNKIQDPFAVLLIITMQPTEGL